MPLELPRGLLTGFPVHFHLDPSSGFQTGLLLQVSLTWTLPGCCVVWPFQNTAEVQTEPLLGLCDASRIKFKLLYNLSFQPFYFPGHYSVGILGQGILFSWAGLRRLTVGTFLLVCDSDFVFLTAPQTCLCSCCALCLQCSPFFSLPHFPKLNANPFLS